MSAFASQNGTASWTQNYTQVSVIIVLTVLQDLELNLVHVCDEICFIFGVTESVFFSWKADPHFRLCSGHVCFVWTVVSPKIFTQTCLKYFSWESSNCIASFARNLIAQAGRRFSWLFVKLLSKAWPPYWICWCRTACRSQLSPLSVGLETFVHWIFFECKLDPIWYSSSWCDSIWNSHCVESSSYSNRQQTAVKLFGTFQFWRDLSLGKPTEANWHQLELVSAGLSFTDSWSDHRQRASDIRLFDLKLQLRVGVEWASSKSPCAAIDQLHKFAFLVVTWTKNIIISRGSGADIGLPLYLCLSVLGGQNLCFTPVPVITDWNHSGCRYP